MAGGKGTRVTEVSSELPKALLPLNGKAVLQYQIECLKQEGFKEVVICIGFMGQKIIDFLEKNSNFGLKIDFVIESEPLGTAGALNLVQSLTEDFLLVYGDIIFDVHLEKFINFHKSKGGIGTLLVHPNDHPQDSDLVQLDGDSKIQSFLMKNKVKKLYSNNVNSGLFILKRKILEYIPTKKIDLVNDIFPKVLLNRHRLYGYQSSEYVKDMGTPSRIREIEKSLNLGIPSVKNLHNYQKAVFIDRDGVVNKEVDNLIHMKDFELIDGVLEAIELLNKSPFLAIIVTNQPAVAKGFCTIETINKINMKLETVLGDNGLKLEAIYFCPHHPEKGFKGENKEYKIECSCRKPKIGLLEKARKSFNIDYSQSFMIGDSTRDILAGKTAGVKTILVKTGYGGKDNTYSVEPDYVSRNLLEAVENIVIKN